MAVRHINPSEGPDVVIFYGITHNNEVLLWDKDYREWFLNGWKTLSDISKEIGLKDEDRIILTIKYGH